MTNAAAVLGSDAAKLIFVLFGCVRDTWLKKCADVIVGQQSIAFIVTVAHRNSGNSGAAATIYSNLIYCR